MLETHLQSIARAGLQYQKDQAAALELERERQEKERIEAERNSPEALRARDIAMMQTTQAEAIAKQQAIERANAEARAAQKTARDAELMLIGDRLAERLAPVITAAIAAGFAQLKADKTEA